MKKRIDFIFAFVFLIAIAGCGGGGDQVAGGIGGTGSAVGSVSAIGSVTVNGVKFETNNATVTIEGEQQPGTNDLSKLKVGMTILVNGTYNNATGGDASKVIYLDNLEGPISAIDSVNNSFTAMGQTVFIDGDAVIGTKFSGVSGLAGLNVNDIVEVSGSPDNAGMLVASFVEKKGVFTNGASNIEVKGNVSNVNVGATTLTIGGLAIDYDLNTTTFKNLLPGDLLNAPFVEVKGTTFNLSGQLIAMSIEAIDRPINPGPGKRLEITGLVTECTPVCSNFRVEGQRIQTNAQTVFKNGVADDLIDSRKVEVEGVIDANGVLVASKLEFVKGSVKIEALADGAADLANRTISVLGITVKTNSGTVFKNGLRLQDIAASDPLKVQGYRIGDRLIIANQIERVSSISKTILQGPLSGLTKLTSQISIIGVAIGSANGQTTFTSLAGNPISFDTFFDTTPLSAIVKAKGSETIANEIDATSGEVEIED